MVDLSKVSEAVQKFVKEVKASEGKKKQIDTKSEYNKLADYLAGKDKELNTTEKEFIQGLMIEYTNTEKQAKAAEAEKAFMESVTDLTKDVAKDVAKLMGNKKQVDTIAEANELVRYLNKNTDLKHSDRKYVENILIESGYEDLLIDRVGILERRMDTNDAIDEIQRDDINKNTMVNWAQNVALELEQKRNDIQDAQIAAGEQRDRAQDEAIAAGEQHDKAQDRAIRNGVIHDRKQDEAIAAGEQHDKAQDHVIRNGVIHDMDQDRAIAENEQRDRAQDEAIAAGEQRDRAQDRAIRNGVRRDRVQDEAIRRGLFF